MSSLLAAEPLWKELPPLPDAEGFAGSFAGVSGGALVVAGGTNFPDKRPWEGGAKVWYDTIFALEKEGGEWQKAGKLPAANGYGVSISTEQGIVVIGGGNATENFRDVYLLRYAEGRVTTEALPSLPQPCAFMAGVRLGQAIYLAGGITTPSSTEALHTFWKLDLEDLNKGWKALESWPGVGRILPTLGTDGDAVYLFSGAGLHAGPDGKAARDWLADAYCYSQSNGWAKIADLPRVAVAAPSPAPWVDGALLVLGGDDGRLVDFEPKKQHPGFPLSVLAYDPIKGAWSVAGELPFSLVTSPSVLWQGRVVIPGGEARPGKRSPAVWWRVGR